MPCMRICYRRRNQPTALSITLPKPNFFKFLCMLPMALARSSTDGIAMCYVLPVLRLTSCFHIMALWRVMYISMQRQEATTSITTSIPTKRCSLIMTGSIHCVAHWEQSLLSTIESCHPYSSLPPRPMKPCQPWLVMAQSF